MRSQPAESVHTRTLVIKNVLVLLTLAGITYYFVQSFGQRAGGTDFPDFYAAARMVQEGHGHELYDVQAQDRFLTRYAGRVGTYYIHPPFETLLYLPFSLGSLRTAYLLWCLFNGGLLVCTAIVFQRHFVDRWDWRVLLILFFLFPPVLLNFLQGQDSLVLLLFMTMAVAALKRGRNVTAGCWLGCGLIKFHVVLGFVLLVASLGKKGLMRGFSLVCLIWLLISAGISGWGFLTAYPRFLMTVSALPMGGMHSAQMANIRGIIGTSGFVPRAGAQLALTLILSAAVIWYERSEAKRLQTAVSASENLPLATFVMAAILVSYHLSPHDLSVMLLALGLSWQCLANPSGVPGWARIGYLSLQGVFFLPPLHLLLLAWHVYAYVGFAILTMFLGARWLRPRNSPDVASSGQI